MQDCVRKAMAYYMSDVKKKNTGKENKFTFIDLFAGIGVMRIAFDQAGFPCQPIFNSRSIEEKQFGKGHWI